MIYLNFSPDLRTQFDSGDEFYVQWRQRFNLAMVTSVIRGAERGAHDNLVDAGPTAIKQAILTSGDRPGKTFFSCTELELVVTSYLMHRLPWLYQACGWAEPLIDRNPSDGNDFRLQNAMPSPYCTMYQVKALDAADKTAVPPTCFAWHADEWMTFQIGVKLGQRDNASKRFVGSHVRFWGAREGEPSELLVDLTWDIRSGSAEDDQKYGKIFFGPYMTNKDPRQDHPLLQTWYDEFIVSRHPIADPGVGTLPPGAERPMSVATGAASNAGPTRATKSAPTVGQAAQSATVADKRTIAAALAKARAAPLSTLAAGVARDLGPFSDGTDAQRARTDYSSIVYDAVDKRMLLFGGGHGPGVDTDIRAFPLATRPSPWQSLYPPVPAGERIDANWDKMLGRWVSVNQPIARHTFNAALMVGRKYYIMTSGGIDGHGVITWYDPDVPDLVKRWSFSRAGQPPWYYASGVALDRISGKVVVYGTDPQATNYLHLWLYDPRSDTISKAADAPAALTGSQIDLHYIPTLDRFVSFDSSGGITEITLDRADPRMSRFAGIATSGPPPPTHANATALAWNGRVLGGDVVDGVFHAYDPTTRTWSEHRIAKEGDGGATISQAFYAIAFDPDSGCFIFIGTDSHTYAYRLPATK
jgi:hypothetical protein